VVRPSSIFHSQPMGWANSTASLSFLAAHRAEHEIGVLERIGQATVRERVTQEISRGGVMMR